MGRNRGEAGHRAATRGTLAAALCALVAASASAQAVRIDNVGCERGIHLDARAAPASEVLRQLSRSLDFRLTMDEALDAPVTIDAVRPAHRLLTDLLGSQSVIITERKDPQCPGRYRVDRVWVLRKGTTQTASAASKALTSIITPEAREQDLLYQRAHGMLPP